MLKGKVMLLLVLSLLLALAACGPTLGKVVFTLNPLTNGVSTTVVDTTIANLKSAKYAINGHKSASEMSSYVFCGNLTQ